MHLAVPFTHHRVIGIRRNFFNIASYDLLIQKAWHAEAVMLTKGFGVFVVHPEKKNAPVQ